MNGTIHTLLTILKHDIASAAETELGALCFNANEGQVMRLTFAEMVQVQTPTPIHYDNSTANQITSGTIKRQCSRAMNMCFFWIAYQADHQNFKVLWAPVQENLGDYSTKHHSEAHHRNVRPFYLHAPQSPQYLQRALASSAL